MKRESRDYFETVTSFQSKITLLITILLPIEGGTPAQTQLFLSSLYVPFSWKHDWFELASN